MTRLIRPITEGRMPVRLWGRGRDIRTRSWAGMCWPAMDMETAAAALQRECLKKVNGWLLEWPAVLRRSRLLWRTFSTFWKRRWTGVVFLPGAGNCIWSFTEELIPLWQRINGITGKVSFYVRMRNFIRLWQGMWEPIFRILKRRWRKTGSFYY